MPQRKQGTKRPFETTAKSVDVICNYSLYFDECGRTRSATTVSLTPMFTVDTDVLQGPRSKEPTVIDANVTPLPNPYCFGEPIFIPLDSSKYDHRRHCYRNFEDWALIEINGECVIGKDGSRTIDRKCRTQLLQRSKDEDDPVVIGEIYFNDEEAFLNIGTEILRGTWVDLMLPFVASRPEHVWNLFLQSSKLDTELLDFKVMGFVRSKLVFQSPDPSLTSAT